MAFSALDPVLTATSGVCAPAQGRVRPLVPSSPSGAAPGLSALMGKGQEPSPDLPWGEGGLARAPSVSFVLFA